MTATFRIQDTTIRYNTDSFDASQLTIESVPFSYRAAFVSEKELLVRLDSIKAGNGKRHFAFIDSLVSRHYGRTVFKGTPLLPVIAKESNKTLPVATRLIDGLAKKGFTKKETFLSVGGGITQDISSFARAVFKRGIRWNYIPTTLLAMADSCIGAKSCLNFNQVKNLLGLFSAPHEVFIYPGFLKTLPVRDVLSGYGEIIKLSIVGGTASVERFRLTKKLQNGDPLRNVEQMIKIALVVKKSVIELDEFENNIRKALNYGHTVGHAIEPLVNYKIPHGIAVSIGMMIENQLAVKWGALSQPEAEELNNMIAPYIDTQSRNLLKKATASNIVRNMLQDKKTLDNEINVAVPATLGQFEMIKIHPGQELERYLDSCLQKISRGKSPARKDEVMAG